MYHLSVPTLLGERIVWVMYDAARRLVIIISLPVRGPTDWVAP